MYFKIFISVFAFLYEKSNSKEICEELKHPFRPFSEKCWCQHFCWHSKLIMSKNARLPQFFLVDSNSHCKDLLFPRGPNLAQKPLNLVSAVLKLIFMRRVFPRRLVLNQRHKITRKWPIKKSCNGIPVIGHPRDRRRLRGKQVRGEPITIKNFGIDTINNKILLIVHGLFLKRVSINQLYSETTSTVECVSWLKELSSSGYFLDFWFWWKQRNSKLHSEEKSR